MHADRQRYQRAIELYLQRCFDALSAARVTEFAAALGKSRSYLARVFPRVLGCSVREALRRGQVAYAQHLLVTTKLSTREIALRAAFGTQATFYRVFTALCAQTPEEYRNRWTK